MIFESSEAHAISDRYMSLIDMEQNWENKILPFTALYILVLTVIIIGLSTKFTFDIYSDYRAKSSFDEILTKKILQQSDVKVMLEKRLMDYRYLQARNTFLAALWLKFLGFLTGIVIVLIGAFFVVSKIKESGSEIKGNVGFGTFLVKSGSPGILLATLGVVLMIFTLGKEIGSQIVDTPRYINSNGYPLQSPNKEIEEYLDQLAPDSFEELINSSKPNKP